MAHDTACSFQCNDGRIPSGAQPFCSGGIVASTLRCSYKGTCSDVKANNINATSGEYSLDIDGEGALRSFNAYCDMDTMGGGWTMVMRRERDASNPVGPRNDDTAISPGIQGSSDVVDDALWQTLKGTANEVLSTLGSPFDMSDEQWGRDFLAELAAQPTPGLVPVGQAPNAGVDAKSLDMTNADPYLDFDMTYKNMERGANGAFNGNDMWLYLSGGDPGGARPPNDKLTIWFDSSWCNIEWRGGTTGDHTDIYKFYMERNPGGPNPDYTLGGSYDGNRGRWREEPADVAFPDSPLMTPEMRNCNMQIIDPITGVNFQGCLGDCHDGGPMGEPGNAQYSACVRSMRIRLKLDPATSELRFIMYFWANPDAAGPPDDVFGTFVMEAFPHRNANSATAATHGQFLPQSLPQQKIFFQRHGLVNVDANLATWYTADPMIEVMIPSDPVMPVGIVYSDLTQSTVQRKVLADVGTLDEANCHSWGAANSLTDSPLFHSETLGCSGTGVEIPVSSCRATRVNPITPTSH